MIHVHRLSGCAPTPLAHYLKAIGILRLIAEQADPQARGWWDGETFVLSSVMDSAGIEGFFLDQYAPTPMLSPWNKGSGFYAAQDPALAPVEASGAARLQPLRTGILAARDLLGEIAAADQTVRKIKDETKVKGISRSERDRLRASPEYKQRLAEAERTFKRLKADLMPSIRRAWRGAHRPWIDAAMVLGEDGAAQFPALLGTGGNDGRLDFTNNFLQRLAEIFTITPDALAPTGQAPTWISGALWSSPTPGLASGKAVGQYLPGGAGGANSDNGPDGNSLVNPFDFVLMLEGAVAFTAHATKRLGAGSGNRAAAPFAVSAQAAGYATAADADESARGEQWMPLWQQPMRLPELQRLLGEGRSQLGRHSPREPLDLARAIARLGTARGISAFQRFGYIERNGQSNLAVPLGRFMVPETPAAALECLDDLDAWLPRLRREARDQHAPARLKHAERQLGDALFAVTQHPDEPARWQRVLLALADLEAIQASGTGFKAGPVPRLRPGWALAADDREPSLRLAVALALQKGNFTDDNARWWNLTRRHWLPLEPRRPARFHKTGSVGHEHLLPGPEVVMHGRSGSDDAIALVQRRLIEAAQHGQRRLPLRAIPGADAGGADLAALLAGQVDLDQTLALARALMAVDAVAWQREPPELTRPRAGAVPDDGWLVLRLALLPEPLRAGGAGEIDLRGDPAIFRRLAAGDAAGAVELALRRLTAAGIRTAVRAVTLPADVARRWAAALAFPISPVTATRFLQRLDPTYDDTKEH